MIERRRDMEAPFVRSTRPLHAQAASDRARRPSNLGARVYVIGCRLRGDDAGLGEAGLRRDARPTHGAPVISGGQTARPGSQAGGSGAMLCRVTKLVSIGRRTDVAGPPDLVALLLECHERIRTFAGLAVDVARRSDLSAADVVEACRRCIRYFEQALPLHVLDEEQSVLPRLLETNMEVRAALEAMHTQHQEHEPQLVQFLAALRALEQAPVSADQRARLEPLATSLAAQFEEHLQLEERVIFPAIREHLSATAQAAVLGELRGRRQ